MLKTSLTLLALLAATTAQAIDVRGLAKALDIVKDEFETKAQFEVRRAKAAPIDKVITLSWKVEKATYDADAQVLTVEVARNGAGNTAELRSDITVKGTYKGTTAFGVSFPVTEGEAMVYLLKASDLPATQSVKATPEVAKRLKPSLWLAADIRLLPGVDSLEKSQRRIKPTIDSPNDLQVTTYVITAQLEQLRIQDGPQGRTVASLDVAGARRQRAEAADATRRQQREAVEAARRQAEEAAEAERAAALRAEEARAAEDQRLRALAQEHEADLQRRAAEYQAAEQARRARRAQLEALVPAFDGDRDTALLVASREEASPGVAPAAVLAIGCKGGEDFVIRVGTHVRLKKTWALGQDLTDVRYAFDADESHRNWERYGLSEAGPMSSIGGFVEQAAKVALLTVAFEVEDMKERQAVSFALDAPAVREHLANLRSGCK